jgi:hypothetical protein
MDARIFSTEKIAKLLKLPEWRVVRFAQVKDYGITPYYWEGTGPGSRRLYSLENLCEMALASWLLDAGLQVKAIGRVLAQVRLQGGLSHFMTSDKHYGVYLGVVRAPKGKNVLQDAVYLRNWEQLEKILGHARNTSVLVLPVGLSFAILQRQLNDTGE